MSASVPCPFVYSKGKKCKGHIVRVEAYKADLYWCSDADGRWSFNTGEPRSHYHLFCSEKGNHAGPSRSDSQLLKFFYQDLPEPLKKVVSNEPRASGAESHIEVLRRQVELSNKKHRIEVPAGTSTLYLIDGSQVLVPEDRIVAVSKEDAAAFGARGWPRRDDE